VTMAASQAAGLGGMALKPYTLPTEKPYIQTKFLQYIERGPPEARKMQYPVSDRLPLNEKGYRKTWRNTPIREWQNKIFQRNFIRERYFYSGIRRRTLTFPIKGVYWLFWLFLAQKAIFYTNLHHGKHAKFHKSSKYH